MDFVVRQSTAEGKEDFLNLYARVRNKDTNTKYSLGFRVTKAEWKRIRSMSYTASALMTSVGMKYGQFCELLSKIKVAIDGRTDPDKISVPALIKSVKADFQCGHSLFVPVSTNGKMLLTDWMDKYIKDLQSGKRHKQHTSVKTSQSHVNNLKSCLNVIKAYEEVRCTKVTLDGVTMEFQRTFISFMQNRGLMPNTITTRMGSIRLVSRAAYLEKKSTATDFMNPDFVPAKQEVDSVFLNPERIEQLRTADLSTVESVKALYKKAKFGKKRLAELPTVEKRTIVSFQKTRDIFIVGCLTGQRYSDYSRISKDMYTELQGKLFIKLRQKKTGKKILIPLDSRVNEILEQWKDKLPTISHPIFQSYLKLLGELMGWTEVPVFDRRDGDDETGDKRFCEMLGSHTARRSFATNAYAQGIPLASIMAITGHSSENNLRRYLKLDAEDKALIAADHFKDFIQEKEVDKSNETEETVEKEE